MSTPMDIQEGMQVYGGDQLLGRVERLHGGGFHVNGLHYTRDMVTRIEHNRIYLGDSGLPGGATTTDESMDMGTVGTTARAREIDTTATAGVARADDLTGGELRVPLAEERLMVGKRDVELGEVNIRKTVVEEERTVPVTLTHEELRVEERAVTDRPATGEMLFKEETINVALHGQEAVIAKEAVITGEVVIEKDAVSQERQIIDTVRKQRVDVDKTTRTVDGAASVPTVGSAIDTSATSASTGRTAYGSQLRESMEVRGADQERIGVIKDVRANDFLVNRRLARDVYVPFSAIQSVTGAGVVVTVDAGDVNDQGWPNP